MVWTDIWLVARLRNAAVLESSKFRCIFGVLPDCLPSLRGPSSTLKIAVQVVWQDPSSSVALKAITTPPHRRMADSNDLDVPPIDDC